MGRTDTNESSSRIKSPIKYYISFGGETGAFSYWDSVEKKNVALEDLDLVVMDTRATITGWSDEHGARIFSNTFKSTKDKINVRAGDKDLLVGTYAEDKEKIKGLGGKYQTNVYALADINGDWVPVILQLSSSALSAWSEFTETNKIWDIYKSLLVVRKGPQQKKGRVTFYTPEFSLEALTDKLTAMADSVYAEKVKPFLEQYETAPVAV